MPILILFSSSYGSKLHFISAWRTTYSISYRLGLVMASSLGFGLSSDNFISLSLLKNSLCIQTCFLLLLLLLLLLFFIQHFKYIILLPSDPIVSYEKLALNLIKDHWYNNNYQNYYLSFFFLAAWKILSFKNLVLMCLGVGLFKIFLVEFHWMCRLMSSIRLWYFDYCIFNFFIFFLFPLLRL